jgi:CubicO group peptidase (beta-lactamase class C family)
VSSPTEAVSDWRDPARLQWAFQHLDELLPTAVIPRGDGPVAELLPHPASLDALPVREASGESGSARTVADVIAATETDAWLVLHDGRLVVEQYLGPMTPDTRHLLMSVSKSLVGIVVGALVDRGVLDVGAAVTAYVPELAASGYAGATLRDVLDMRTGVRFSEDYLDPEAEVTLLDEAVGWAPRVHGGPRTLKEFLASTEAERPHGGHFQYRSCETDVLGWVVEAATGRPFAEVASDLLWARLDAERDAFITVDSAGTGMFDGGINTTLRDLARFGTMLLDGGTSPTGEQLLAPAWIDDVFSGTEDLRAAFAAGPHAGLLPGGHYRSQFWVPAGGEVILAVGIHGQLLYVDRAARMVGAKLSHWPVPTDGARTEATLALFGAIAQHLVRA